MKTDGFFGFILDLNLFGRNILLYFMILCRLTVEHGKFFDTFFVVANVVGCR